MHREGLDNALVENNYLSDKLQMSDQTCCNLMHRYGHLGVTNMYLPALHVQLSLSESCVVNAGHKTRKKT